MIDLERDEFWLWRYRWSGGAPELPDRALFYDCDGPPNTLIDLALGKEVDNCYPVSWARGRSRSSMPSTARGPWELEAVRR